MIEEFAHAFQANEGVLRQKYASDHPASYQGIFTDLVQMLADLGVEGPNDWNTLDPQRITVINDGDYQGTLVFIVGVQGYQPDSYYACKVSYGSCSGCDTFEAVRGYSWDTPPSQQQIDDYLSLARHMVQALVQV